MAKLKDLAGLAALGMLGYKMSQGNKSTTDTGDKPFKPTNESSYAPGNAGTARPGVGDATNDPLAESKPAPAPAPKPKVEAKVDTDTKAPSVVPGGVNKRTEGNKPMPSLKAVEARAASNKTDAMRNASRKAAAASKSKTPPAATKSETPVTPKPTTRSPNILEEAKEEARRRATASQATSTPSSTSPVTRTPFPGSSALNKKHGGAVKMASGGMAASRRADGIAQRGKTRGKMC